MNKTQIKYVRHIKVTRRVYSNIIPKLLLLESALGVIVPPVMLTDYDPISRPHN